MRALAGLMAVGASLALALADWLGPWKANLFVENTLPQSGRIALLSCAAAGAGVAFVLGCVLARRFGIARLPGVARFVAPLGLAAFMPAVLSSEGWSNQLDLALALAAIVLLSRPLFRFHLRAYEEPQFARLLQVPQNLGLALERRLPARLRGRLALAVVVSGALAYAGYMASYTVLKHLRFETFTWDLAQFDSEFYNTLHGQPFRCPALMSGPAWSDLATHAHFGIWLLTPFYALHPAAETLLVLQAVIVGSGVIPLYRFAARRLSAASALAVAFAYLLYPPLHGAQFFDFHFQPVATAFVLFAIDFLDQRRLRLFAIFFVASLACREDVAIGLSSLGLYVLLFTRRTVQGAAILGISAAYFALMRFVIMPSFGSWGFADFYKALIPAGQSGFGPVIVTLVTNPIFAFKSLLTADKLRYALQILTPLAFLPLSRPRLWLSLVLGALVTLLTGAASLIDIGFQYGGSFAPYVFPACVLAIACAGREPSPLADPQAIAVERGVSVLALVLGTLLTTAQWGAFPPRAQYRSAYGRQIKLAGLDAAERERLAAFRAAVSKIPRDAIVAAGDHELPHVSNRIEGRNMNNGYDDADYLLYDPQGPLPQERSGGAAARAAGWIVVAEHPHFFLLKNPAKR